jgi:hypothetical protein
VNVRATITAAAMTISAEMIEARLTASVNALAARSTIPAPASPPIRSAVAEAAPIDSWASATSEVESHPACSVSPPARIVTGCSDAARTGPHQHGLDERAR